MYKGNPVRITAYLNGSSKLKNIWNKILKWKKCMTANLDYYIHKNCHG